MAIVAGPNVDLAAVRSRVSWGAILAGAAVALAIYSLLAMLGVAVGFSVSDNLEGADVDTGVGVWTFISLLIALFIGGWVTTQCTAGESRTEALLYGIVLWATTSVLMLWLGTAGLQTAATIVMTGQRQADAAADTTQTGQTPTPEERQRMLREFREQGQRSSWWAFAGMLISMLAAIGGALIGPYEFTIRREFRTTVRESRTDVT
jgi:ABC-type transport system involved in multi-copper enzyme maturation permease subunit